MTTKLCGAAILAALFLAQPALAADNDPDIVKAASDAFASCLAIKIPDAKDPRGAQIQAAAPPGMAAPTLKTIVRLPTKSGELYLYRDSGTADISCGIVVYGAAEKDVSAALAGVIAKRKDLVAKPAATYKLAGDFSKTVYLGDSLAPTIAGIVLLTGPKTATGPVVQADYHTGRVP